MHLRSGFGWIVLHVLPLLVYPALVPLIADRLTPEALRASAYVVLAVFLVLGQAIIVRGVRGWAVITAAGLFGGLAAGVMLLRYSERTLRLPEFAAIVLAHTAGGLMLGAVQATGINKRFRLIWILASASGWGLGAAAAYALYPATWLPGMVRGAFPGRLELTRIVRLLPIYAVLTLVAVKRRGRAP